MTRRAAVVVLAVLVPSGCALDPWQDIKDPSLETRARSAAALGAVTEPARVPEAGRVLREAWRTEVTIFGRATIIRALARLGDPEADALAGEGLADREAGVRAACAAALATLGVTGRRPELRRLLADAEADVRTAAARALGALADADPPDLDSIPPLIARLDDEPAVSVAAHGALQALTLQPLPREAAAWRAWWQAVPRAGGPAGG